MNHEAFYVGEAVKVMSDFPEDIIDLTVTSPPYDDLRNYNGYTFDAETMLESILRITRPGGVCVWIVGERIKGGRSLNSFKHAFIGKDLGWHVHDVMIYQKMGTPFARKGAYTPCYELMIVFSKGKPTTFNPIMEPTKHRNWNNALVNKGPDGVNTYQKVKRNDSKVKNNIWVYATGLGGSTRDKIAFQHPAIMPEKLAEDHIRSWSNHGDLVLDPMCGSGTVCKMAHVNGRKFIGIDISEEYIDLAKRRMQGVMMFDFE